VKGQESDTPTLEGALPNVGGNYNTELVPEGDFQILSWAGDFVISNMTIGLPSQDVEPEPEILPIGYLNNTVCPLGVTLRDLDNPVTGKWYTVLPLDLSQDCTYVYPLIGGNVYVIGEVRITVAAGTVTVDYEYYNLSYMHEWPTEVLGEHLNFFGDISTAAVKYAVKRNEAVCMPDDEAVGLIRRKAKESIALIDKIRPYRVTMPMELKLELNRSDYCDNIVSYRKDVDRLDSRTVRRVVNKIETYYDVLF